MFYIFRRADPCRNIGFYNIKNKFSKTGTNHEHTRQTPDLQEWRILCQNVNALIEKRIEKEKLPQKYAFPQQFSLVNWNPVTGFLILPASGILYSGQVFSCSGVDLDHIPLVYKQRHVYYCASFHSRRFCCALSCISGKARLCLCNLQLNK